MFTSCDRPAAGRMLIREYYHDKACLANIFLTRNTWSNIFENREFFAIVYEVVI